MTAEQNTIPRVTKSRTLNPWLVASAGLLVYALTLTHWVTLRGLPWIATTVGWDWHPIPISWRPAYFAPLWSLLTLPVRILPIGWQPVALNLFSAVCAGLSLALLAQSVHLFPHDRTREQRIREPGEYALFSGRLAWVPQLFAVLVLMFQGVFWDNAVNASNEMLDLLVFAFLINSLLRFRISQNERTLLLFAFIYGLGVANSFALVGFFPLFLVAVIWIKGFTFFNLRFILRMTGCGLAGLLLFLLPPLQGCIGTGAESFGTLLRLEFTQESFLLRIIPGWIPLVASLSTIAPLLCSGFKWPEIEGELSAAGNALTRITFMAMNVLFLPVALLIFFDWRFSTNPHVHDAPTPFLTFYYLGALAVGYYSGYILIVFGKRSMQRLKFKSWPALDKAILAMVWILLAAAPLGLLYNNLGRLRYLNNNVLARFTAETISALPAKPSIVLSDDPIRLQLLEAGYRKLGLTNPHILLETSSLAHKQYFAYLMSRYPELKKKMLPVDKFPDSLADSDVVRFLNDLAADFPVYYLHPSFGYFFEQYYTRPHRLVYELKRFPANSFLPPPASPAEVKENTEFWGAVQRDTLGTLPKIAEEDWDAARVSVDYSVALDYWGVELQKANHLPEASAAFAEAFRVNTNNLMAQYNLEYNQQLQHGDHRPLGQSDTLARALAMYRSVPDIIKYNGPPDEPDVDMAFGQNLAQGNNLRQAATLFERRLQLLPNDTAAKMAVAKTLVDTGAPDRALELTRQIRAQTNNLPDELFWVEGVAYLVKTNYAAAERSLLQGQQQEPNNAVRLANTLEFYRRTGVAALRGGHRADAVNRLQKALAVITKLLQVLNADKAAMNTFNLPDVLMIKADIEVSLEAYPAAIATLSQVIDMDNESASALLSRSMLQARLKKFPEAKEDAEALLKAAPKKSYIAYSALAEIARDENDIEAQKKYLRLFLKAVPSASPQYAAVKKELDKLAAR